MVGGAGGSLLVAAGFAPCASVRREERSRARKGVLTMSPSSMARRGAGEISNQMKKDQRPAADEKARMIASGVVFQKTPLIGLAHICEVHRIHIRIILVLSAHTPTELVSLGPYAGVNPPPG